MGMCPHQNEVDDCRFLNINSKSSYKCHFNLDRKSIAEFFNNYSLTRTLRFYVIFFIDFYISFIL